MKLFLHFPSSVLFQVPVVSQVFSGNFASEINSKVRNSEFFSKITEMLPEGLIIANNEGDILSMNKSSFKILNISTKFDCVKDFLQWEKFEGSAEPLLELTNGSVNGSLGIDGFVEVSKRTIDDKIVFSLRNITMQVRCQNLINEELKKINKLLKTILPPSLVERFLRGEKNISFSVPSATILFLDIVSFTPWCGSNTAQMVMSTLNLMFKYFDEALMKGPSLYRIKCIGDCYVAAGGIFQEPNDPVIHATEMVHFGLDAISCVERINREKGTKLKIRVGINTGGPIVAGVIGLGKPTFEILGSPIVMAQQMEQNGVPMHVHISRSTYELIYGAEFNVKERGSMVAKTGNVVTYLVKPFIC
jgi:class 3 adenylate cyclase